MKIDLKNKLATLIEKDDGVSILTFASSKDVKVVLSNWKVNQIDKDSDAFNKAIDNFVYSRGCTCFNDPLEEAIKVVKQGKFDNTSVLFLTD
jgi:uncharacterized protein with von Willebrand factor type A (vWA) domain